MLETKGMCHAKCAAPYSVSIRENILRDQFLRALKHGRPSQLRPWSSEAEINQCFNFAASRLRVKPDPDESHIHGLN
jgi:hypothetical protein